MAVNLITQQGANIVVEPDGTAEVSYASMRWFNSTHHDCVRANCRFVGTACEAVIARVRAPSHTRNRIRLCDATMYMDAEQRVTWFAGLFEGEGSFCFLRGRPRSMSIQMTDLDVLQRVKEYFGGTIYPMTKRQEHWKDAWKWTIFGTKSVELAQLVLPYLGVRRSHRATEYIENYGTLEKYNLKRREKFEELATSVRSLRTEGLTHKQIADRLEIDRTYVTHILNGRNKHKVLA